MKRHTAKAECYPNADKVAGLSNGIAGAECCSKISTLGLSSAAVVIAINSLMNNHGSITRGQMIICTRKPNKFTSVII